MFEKVNPMHPDKIADRIAGAIVDLAYKKNKKPKMACEVLIGHGICHIICETSEDIKKEEAEAIVKRIAGDNIETDFVCCKQDVHLAGNQAEGIKCGDNGIFRGMPVTYEQELLSDIARDFYDRYKSDGKYILDISKSKVKKNMDFKRLIVCQSNAKSEDLINTYPPYFFNEIIYNPLGYWTGGTDVDTGVTNRKLGSDMGDAVTGGGLHGKDLSKADVSVNIYAHMKAQMTGEPVELYCAIGDNTIDGKPYFEIVEIASKYIKTHGGFEKFAEWGLI